jgi:hypothetical protein
MVSNTMHTTYTSTSADIATDTHESSPKEALPGLPNHIVATHILRSEYFDDPADLARLPAASRAMRDTVAEIGLEFEELDESRALNLGCLSALRRRQRRGHLSDQGLLCEAAARGGHLEELKLLRENDTPWDEWTCSRAARARHLEVLQWAHANGCPFDEKRCVTITEDKKEIERCYGYRLWDTIKYSANGTLIKVLKWLRENGAQVGKFYTEEC